MSDVNNDKFNITIRVADLPPMPMQISRADESIVRLAEYNVNRLYRSWSQRFADKSAYEVLAMVAFQFARAYVTLNSHSEQTDQLLDSVDKALSRLLIDTDE